MVGWGELRGRATLFVSTTSPSPLGMLSHLLTCGRALNLEAQGLCSVGGGGAVGVGGLDHAHLVTEETPEEASVVMRGESSMLATSVCHTKGGIIIHHG